MVYIRTLVCKKKLIYPLLTYRKSSNLSKMIRPQAKIVFLSNFTKPTSFGFVNIYFISIGKPSTIGLLAL